VGRDALRFLGPSLSFLPNKRRPERPYAGHEWRSADEDFHVSLVSSPMPPVFFPPLRSFRLLFIADEIADLACLPPLFSMLSSP